VSERTIWKYPLNGIITKVSVPAPARPVNVNFDTDGNTATRTFAAWFETTRDGADEHGTITLVSTGENVPPNATYVGSVQSMSIILHAYYGRDQ
jgi:hypothetical protein